MGTVHWNNILPCSQKAYKRHLGCWGGTRRCWVWINLWPTTPTRVCTFSNRGTI